MARLGQARRLPTMPLERDLAVRAARNPWPALASMMTRSSRWTWRTCARTACARWTSSAVPQHRAFRRGVADMQRDGCNGYNDFSHSEYWPRCRGGAFSIAVNFGAKQGQDSQPASRQAGREQGQPLGDHQTRPVLRRIGKSRRSASGRVMAGALSISREQAAALGRKRYFTGEPCRHGHIASSSSPASTSSS
jgi:hypothetical protein